MLFHRRASGRINGQDAGELRGAPAGTGAVGVLVERALHEGIQQTIGGVVGHALDAPIAPAIAAVDGRQAVNRFSTDHGSVLGLQLGLLTRRDVALDQVAGAEIKQGDLAPVFIAHGKHFAGGAADGHCQHGDGFGVDAERVVGQRVVAGIHWDVVFPLQLRQASEGCAVGALQAYATQFADSACGPVDS